MRSATCTPDTDACRVLPGSLVVEPNGVSSVINQATVTWRGGQEIVDESAGSPYGPRGVSIDTQAASSDVARGLGAWIIGRNSQPAAKVKALEVDPAATPAEFPMALGVQVFDRVAYRSHPQQVGTATTKALEVLGRHEQLEGMDWRIAFYLTGHPDQGVDLFTLSVSQLSGPHILAY